MEKAIVKHGDFISILDDFRHELSRLDENSALVMDKACRLRDFRQPVDKDPSLEGPTTVPDGIINNLRDCINVFREYNARVAEIGEGLTGFVG